MSTLAPGTRVGPYEVVSFLAAGGMGEVYRAHDARLGRAVAIKILPARLLGDAAAIARFDREARAAAAVSHPNLISIYDVGEAGELRYLVMDLLEGETLRQRLQAGALPWADAVDIALAVTEGIGAVHARGLVHRDLKPENVFLTTTGWVKLLDFGLAVLTLQETSDHDDTVEIVTRRDSVVGTTPYMSPEQLRGEELDARSDLFAIGCVLYEMLAGKAAFRRDSRAETIAAILSTGEIELRAPMPGELFEILRRCLERPRERRFQSAAELASALRLVGRSPVRRTAETSIAVLPFVNLSKDAENDYFSDGLSEEILDALARVPGLRVTARTSAFAFRGQQQDVRRIGELLGVGTVLEGGVRRAADRVRVTVRLVDARSGYHLWSARFDRAMTDVFAVQDEIAAAIVDTLALKLLPATKAPPRQTSNVNAYHAYLKSRYHFGKLTPQRLAAARAHALEAIALDPSYAAAYTALADCLIQTAIYGIQPGTEVVPQARTAALQAVALDEGDAAAHMLLARIAGEHDHDWDEALRRAGSPFAAIAPRPPSARSAPSTCSGRSASSTTSSPRSSRCSSRIRSRRCRASPGPRRCSCAAPARAPARSCRRCSTCTRASGPASWPAASRTRSPARRARPSRSWSADWPARRGTRASSACWPGTTSAPATARAARPRWPVSRTSTSPISAGWAAARTTSRAATSTARRTSTRP